MRVFSASLFTETNTFGPMPTGLASFHEQCYFAAGQHPDRMVHSAAPTWVARDRGAQYGWDLREGLVAAAQPSGTTTRQAYETLRDQILADLRAALPVDIVLIGLHGAMVAEGYDDCEGDLLQRVRALAGPDAVIGGELDPHCHLSEAMVDSADLLIAFKHYPHTDALERAFELVDLCAATAATGRISPRAVADCEMMAVFPTSRDPARSFVDRMQSLEGHDGVLSVSLIHGFALGDVPDMGTRMLVYTDGQPAQAETLARQLADEVRAMRPLLFAPRPDIDGALDQALALEGMPVVVADSAD
ncbi:MAG: M81 family peptidase, partial [Lysobacteraceae bacterium]